MCGIWFFIIGFLALPSCGNSDNLGLLLDTLKVIHRTICNDETVTLTCPNNTTISIRVAQYGKSPEEQGCPALVAKQTEETKNCKRPNAMQYSLLQTVVEACQKKQSCTFSTELKSGFIDPCPTQSKYIEVTYKCRPHTFLSRDICDGEGVMLNCKPYTRIAIYEAVYGRTKFEATRCQATGVSNESCSDPHAVKTVIQQCLGKRRCQIVANNRTFNSSCSLHSKPYLKVASACVPLGILSEKYESVAEKDEISTLFDNNVSFVDESADEDGEIYSVFNPDHVQLPPLDDNPPPTRRDMEETTLLETQTTVEITKRVPGSHRYTSTILLYVGSGILVFISIIGIIIGIRCYLNRRINENSKNGDMYTTEAPNVYSDAFSDIDNDADISHISGTFHDPLHPDMILYKNVPGSRGTLRAMKPLCTIYPSPVEASMYGNVDYVPSRTREQVTAPRFTRSRSNEEGNEPNIMTSPRSLGAPSSNYYYG